MLRLLIMSFLDRCPEVWSNAFGSTASHHSHTTTTDEFIMSPLQRHRHSAWLLLVLSVSLLWVGCAEQRPAATDREIQSTLDDILPLTAANLRGHKMLYDEGWFIVTSSRNALTYAKNTSVFSSASHSTAQ